MKTSSRTDAPHLIPAPKHLRPRGGSGATLSASARGAILRRANESPAVRCRTDRSLPAEGYRLAVGDGAIRVDASTPRGRAHAFATLRQLVAQYPGEIPALEIEDSPDFAHRGFMLDVSRGRVPRRETLFELIDLLADLKYNQLQLYIEHTFAFARHPLIGRGHSPFTAADLRAADARCRQRGIEFVPNLQSFGHAAHTLKHKRYAHLAESDFRGGWTLTPVDPGTYELLGELFEDFLPSFSHRPFFNVGCDETWDLGRGRSAAMKEKVGLGRVYLSHLLGVHKLVRRHRRRMMFWGDIIENYPELVAELPEDVVVLNWEYEAGDRLGAYDKRLEPSVRAGREHWVCPGSSCWNTLFFRMENARANIREFARSGHAAGAAGFLLTNWGDNGHYNFLSQALWPIARGAEASWNADAPGNRTETFDRRFDESFARLVLGDDAGDFIAPLRRLGNLSRTFRVEVWNTSPERMFLTGMMKLSPDRLGVVKEIGEYNRITRRDLERALGEAEAAARELAAIRPANAAAGRVRDEWSLCARLSAHACRRGLLHNHAEGDPKGMEREIRALAGEYESRWLARDRESDLHTIRAEFAETARQYRLRDREPIRF